MKDFNQAATKGTTKLQHTAAIYRTALRLLGRRVPAEVTAAASMPQAEHDFAPHLERLLAVHGTDLFVPLGAYIQGATTPDFPYKKRVDTLRVFMWSEKHNEAVRARKDTTQRRRKLAAEAAAALSQEQRDALGIDPQGNRKTRAEVRA